MYTSTYVHTYVCTICSLVDPGHDEDECESNNLYSDEAYIHWIILAMIHTWKEQYGNDTRIKKNNW